MSATSSSSTAAWPPNRPNKRNKLRNGTFIIPTTGERSRRQFTLRSSAGMYAGNSADDAVYFEPETTRERFDAFLHDVKLRLINAWYWLDTSDGHQVLKCTLAYLLGSMATFVPFLSDFLGHRDGKHIVATLTVYFHPARTLGSMIEAILIAIVAVTYAEIVNLFSMAVSIASRKKLDSVVPAHGLVLIVCIGGGLGFVGWVKQRLNQPLVNVASTLASIAIISMITKEDSIQDGYFSGEKIIQVLKMLLVGITFSSIVNVLIWPISARRVLRQSIASASGTLSDRLSFITRGFLNGDEDEVNSPAYKRVRKQYAAAYGVMAKTLREAKLEYYFSGREKIYDYDKRLVKSLDSLSQAIGGLRSALNTQLTLLKEDAAAKTQGSDSQGPFSPGPLSPKGIRPPPSSFFDVVERLSVIEEDLDEQSNAGSNAGGSKLDGTTEQTPIFKSPSDIFTLFMALLGPSMKSLVYTLSEIMRQSPFGEDITSDIIVDDQLRESLREALTLYNSARKSALKDLYKSMQLGRARPEAIQADIEEVGAACGHFSFGLQAVAEALDAYLDALEDLKHWTAVHTRSWEWLKFWKRGRGSRSDEDDDDPECAALLHRKASSGVKRTATPKGIPTAMLKRRDTFSWDASPKSGRWLKYLSQSALGFMRVMSREDVLFGIKVGIGAILWAMFAFIPATRPTYYHWRGEWGLLSYMIVVGMTTGASNTTGSSRFIGTVIGASCACLAWIVSTGNPFALALLGCFMAIWNFYLILVVKNGPMGRISLLAYNVIVLYAYSLSQDVDDDDDDEGGKNPLIFDITYHRLVAVVVGIIWGIVICRLLWPISGRAKFREGLAVLYLQLGLIWKRGPLTILLQSNNTVDYMTEEEQAALQRYSFKLESLRESAKSEFELRGPFPKKAYARVMHSTKHILEGFSAMRLITQRRVSLSAGERALLEFTAAERLQLCQRICHVLQVLASCIMLEYPLTDAIPTIESNKDRLLGKIYQFRRDHMEPDGRVIAAPNGNGNGTSNSGSGADHADGDANGSTSDGMGTFTTAAADATAPTAGVVVEESDYALVYAYILVTAEVAAELKKVRGEIEGLFGVLNTNAMLLE